MREGIPVPGGTGLGYISQHSGQKAVLCKTPVPEICNLKHPVLPSFLVAMYIHRAISCLPREESLQMFRDLVGFVHDADTMPGPTCLQVGTRLVHGLAGSEGSGRGQLRPCWLKPTAGRLTAATLLLNAEPTDSMGQTRQEKGQERCKLRPGSDCF